MGPGAPPRRWRPPRSALHAPATLVIVLAHVGDVDDFRDDVATFAGILPEVFPAWEKPPRELAGCDEVFGRRMRVLRWLGSNSPPRLVVTSFQATLQPVPKPELIARMARTVSVGEAVPVEMLTAWMLERGMARAEVVEVPGEFSVRGGILDVFPVDATDPVRIEFFGDEIESIRPFDVESQRSLDRWTSVTLTAAAGFDEAQIADFGHAARFFPEGTWVALIEPQDLREEGRHYLERLEDRRGLFSVEEGFERLDSPPHDRHLDARRRLARDDLPLADREHRALLRRAHQGQGRAFQRRRRRKCPDRLP